MLKDSIKKVIIKLSNNQLTEDLSDELLSAYINNLPVLSVLKILNELLLEDFPEFISYYKKVSERENIKNVWSLSEASNLLDFFIGDDLREDQQKRLEMLSNDKSKALLANLRMLEHRVEIIVKYLQHETDLKIESHGSAEYLNLSSRTISNKDFVLGRLTTTELTRIIKANGADIRSTQFVNGQIKYSCFDRINANDVSFFKVALSDVTFINSYLEKVHFFPLESLIRVDFSTAELVKVKFSAMQAPAFVYMVMPTLAKVNFSDATLTEVDFIEVYLRNICFDRAKCNSLNFDKVTLEDVSFVGVYDFSRINLKDTSLIRVKILGECTAETIASLLDKLAPSINKHDQVKLLRAALVDEIIAMAVKLEKSEGIALLQAAHDHATMFAPRDLFSSKSTSREKLKLKIEELKNKPNELAVQPEMVLADASSTIELNAKVKDVVISFFENKKEPDPQESIASIQDDKIQQFISSLPYDQVLQIFNKLQIGSFINFIEYYQTLPSYAQLEKNVLSILESSSAEIAKTDNSTKHENSDRKLTDSEILLYAMTTKDARSLKYVLDDLVKPGAINQKLVASLPNLITLLQNMILVLYNANIADKQKQPSAAIYFIKKNNFINLSSRVFPANRFFIGASFTHVVINARNATFNSCLFKEMHIINSCFDEVTANSSTISVNSLSNVTFRGAKLFNVNFQGCKHEALHQVDFSGATLHATYFEMLHLKDVSFAYVNFKRLNFFTMATLTNVSFVGVVNFSNLRFEGAKLKNVKILGDCDAHSFVSKWGQIAASINNHPQVHMLKDALVEEIESMISKLERSKGVALLQAVLDPKNQFVFPNSGLFSRPKSAGQVRLESKLKELTKIDKFGNIDSILMSLTIDKINEVATEAKAKYLGSSSGIFKQFKSNYRNPERKSHHDNVLSSDGQSQLGKFALLNMYLEQMTTLSFKQTEKKFFISLLCNYENKDDADLKELVQYFDEKLRVHLDAEKKGHRNIVREDNARPL